MRNTIISILLIAFVSTTLQAQRLNIDSSNITPAPLASQTQGGSGVFCFDVYETSSVANPVDDGSPAQIQVTLSNLDLADGVNSISGHSDYFITAIGYLGGNTNIFFLHNAEFPADGYINICLDVVVTTDTFIDNPNNGGVVNLTPGSSQTVGTDYTEVFTYVDPTIQPVELISFTAEADNADAVLEWVTATETNNSHFEIERSLDGLNFEFIDLVESQALTGNSDQELAYEYIDKEAAVYGDAVYYRVKQVDLGGVDAPYAYTPIRVVLFEDVELGAKVFPNPAEQGQNVTIQASSIRTVEVYTSSGQLVDVIEEPNEVRTTSISTSDLATGLYIAIINGKERLKFVVN